MAEIVKMPKLSDTMTEGVLVKWLKKEGDKVSSGEILAEIETDKATMEFESFYNGTLLHIGIKEGVTASVDKIIAIIGEKGENIEAILKKENNSQPEKLPDSVKTEPVKKTAEPVIIKEPLLPVAIPLTHTKSESFETTENHDRIKASPLAKKIASESGVNLMMVKGSGDYGRIVKRDIELFIKGGVSVSPFIGKESFDEVAVSQMRKAIARRLSESKFTSPHFYLSMEINMDQAIEARKSINEFAPVKISFNDFIIKAVATALRENPKVNSSWLGDRIRYNHHIHIGIAIAVDEGLLVPVLKFADGKSLSQISSAVKVFAEKAKSKKLQPQEMEGNTFTISNLGMYGIDEFTAIINPPDACILAVGGIKAVPIVKDGKIIAGNIMKVTLSCDHRVVDGAKGSEFLKSLKTMLENPYKLLARNSV